MLTLFQGAHKVNFFLIILRLICFFHCVSICIDGSKAIVDKSAATLIKVESGGGLVTQLCPILATPWTVTHLAPLSMGFSRQEYWSGLPFPSPGDLPDPGIELGSHALQGDSLMTEPPGKLNQGSEYP